MLRLQVCANHTWHWTFLFSLVIPYMNAMYLDYTHSLHPPLNSSQNSPTSPIQLCVFFFIIHGVQLVLPNAHGYRETPTKACPAYQEPQHWRKETPSTSGDQLPIAHQLSAVPHESLPLRTGELTVLICLDLVPESTAAVSS